MWDRDYSEVLVASVTLQMSLIRCIVGRLRVLSPLCCLCALAGSCLCAIRMLPFVDQVRVCACHSHQHETGVTATRLHTCRTDRKCACGSPGSLACEHRLCHIEVGTPPLSSVGLEPSAAGRSPVPPPLLRAKRAACLCLLGAPPLNLVVCPSSGDPGLDTTASCMHELSALTAWP